MKNRVYIVDVTNRDGVQTSQICLSKLQKTMLNIYLNEMGIHQSEMGFPATPHETNYINVNMELAKRGVLRPMILTGWVRALRKDIELATSRTEIKDLNISISTSKQMIKGKLEATEEVVIENMTGAVDLAKDRGIRTIGVNAEDASRTDMDFLIRFAQAAKDRGANRIRYCDTLGYDTPFSIYERIYTLGKEIKLPVEMHCHNDLGMAVACSIAGAKGALDAGVDAYINTTVNGIGERAGNADLVSVILTFKHGRGMQDYELAGGIDLKMVWEVSKYASYAFDIPIPINQPGVGANAFAHESGIHADGALKDRRNYELYDFEDLGRGEPEIVETGRSITVGEYSGVKGFRNVYEKLEIEFKSEEEARKILELVRYANIHNQKPLTNRELHFIASYPEIARKLFSMEP